MKISLAFVVAGCNFADSSAVATSELRADIQVVADGSGPATVFTWLWSHKAGDPPLNQDSIRLVDGDQLDATSSGRAVAMQEADLVAEYRYGASFDPATGGQSFEVSLSRGEGAGAPDSTVTLPDPFGVAAPATFSRGRGLTVSWSSSGSPDAITLRLQGTCATATLGPVADVGSMAIAADAVTPTSDDQASATCDLELDVTRTRNGSLDPAYGQGGSITASQQRSATITSTP